MEFFVIKSKRKTISINVDELGNIKVYAPYNVSNDKIYDFINKKHLWIEKHANKNRQTADKYAQVISKQKGLIFGKIVEITDNFDDTLKILAKEYLQIRLNYLSEKYNFNFNRLIIKNYKSRWGACDKNKNIYLNYKLVSIDKNLIDYVIIHELCHTLEFNHKQNFHKILSSYFENEKILRQNLKNFSFVTKLSYK